MSKPKDPDYFKKYYKAHPEKFISTYHNRKRKVFTMLGNVCACCGFDEYSCLQIDHVNNDGADHRRERYNSNSVVMNDILCGRVEAQLLCGNCHNSKTKLGQCYHTF